MVWNYKGVINTVCYSWKEIVGHQEVVDPRVAFLQGSHKCNSFMKYCSVFLVCVWTESVPEERSRCGDIVQLKSPPTSNSPGIDASNRKRFSKNVGQSTLGPYRFTSVIFSLKSEPCSIKYLPAGSDSLFVTWKGRDLWINVITPLALVENEAEPANVSLPLTNHRSFDEILVKISALI